MKHGSLISPDEGSFGFGTSKSMFEATSAGHQSGETVTVPDAELLFNGEFKRAGDDLKIIGQDGKSFLVEDYFKKDKHPTLLSPEGAALTGDVVDALAGPLAAGQYAQAGAPQSANQAIGRVEKVDGNATVVRNGVTITLNTGDVIQKGDVAQTGSGGSLAIVFSDGTAFNLAANARMVLNDFVYSAGGSNNSALISLVQGSISFVAGQVAKTGDMRVETPVATMGIRGTAVLVEISANNGATKFSVMVESNGTVGSFTLYDKASGAVLGVVNNSAIGWVVTPAGPQQVIAQQLQKTPAELAQELAIIQQLMNFNPAPFDPNAPQPPQPPSDPNKRGDVNPQGGPTGTTIIPSNNGNIIVTTTPLTPPATGNNNTNTNTNNSDNPPPGTTGTGGGDGPGAGGDGPTQQQASGPNALNGGSGGETFGPVETGPYDFYTTEGNDHVIAGGGDDDITAGHGGGNDIYDGGEGLEEGGDTIRFASANGVTFQLNSFVDPDDGILKSRALSNTTGSDIFFNIENIVASPGNDVFVLHNVGDGFHIDAGCGFDIVKLLDDVDVHANDGFDVSNFEMIDLTSVTDNLVPNTTIGNTIELEGEGVMDANADGELRVLGDSKDTVKLLSDVDGNVGHWEFVADGHRSDAQLFTLGDHYSDGVTFNRYVFVSDSCGEGAGEILATAYIDEDVKVVMSAPEALVEQGAVGDGTPETTVKLSSGDVDYDLTGWGLGSGGNVYAHGGHYYQYVHQTGLSWTGAQAAALLAGGYLVNITSEGENNFTRDLIGSQGYVTYLGASDAADEGTFVWANGPEAGQAVTFTYWAPGEPNNDGNEDYLSMVSGPGANEGGHWNDVPHAYGLANGYLVEYDSYDTSTLTKQGVYGYVTLDTETNELTYHLNDADADTQALAEGQTATETFAIVVDENGTPVTHNVEFTIHGSNDAPEVAQDLSDQQATPKEEFSFSFGTNVFTDVDAGDSLTHSAKILGEHGYEDLPAWLHFDSATRTFSGTPPEGSADDYTIKVTATDSHGQSASESFTLTVDTPPTATEDAIANATRPSGEGWVLNEANGHYYRVVHDQPITWQDAADLAAQDGGAYLATITNASEQTFVQNLASGIYAWLGGYGSIATDVSTWHWISGPENGSSLAYENWFHNAEGHEPNGWEDRIDAYLEMNPDGSWNDVPTDWTQQGYVEEWGGLANQIAFREDTATTLTAAQLLANDTDADLDTLTITGVINISEHGGTVTLDHGIITYIPAENYNGADSFTYTLSDGTKTTTGTVSFNVAAVNDAPVADSGDAAEVNYTIGAAGVPVDSDITLSDIDSAALHGATVKIENFQDGDTLIFATLGAITGEYDPETGVLTLTGDAGIEDYQAALRSISYQNNYPAASTADRTISYQVDDGSASHNLSEIVTSTIHVEEAPPPENQAPTLDATVLADPEGDGGQVYQIFSGHFHDADGGWLAGLAISGVNADPDTQGVWQYYDSGWQTIEADSVSMTNALVLNYASGIRFVPVEGYTGTPSLTVHALDTDLGQNSTGLDHLDLTSLGTGGTSHVSDAATLSAPEGEVPPPTNEAPIISIETADVNGGEFATTLFGLAVSDPDDDEFDVTIVTQRGSLSLKDETVNDGDDSPNGISFHATLCELNDVLQEGVTYTNPLPYPGENDTDAVTLTISDQHGNSDSINFIFNVFGTSGVDLEGTSGKDVLFSTGNCDNLAGAGGNDTFVFSFYEMQIGNDVIADFHAGEGANMDKIFLEGAPFITFEDLESQITYENGNAIINLGPEGQITLNNVADQALNANNFIIHPGPIN